MPLITTGSAVPGLYSHIAHSVDKDKAEIPQPFKAQNQSKAGVETNLKENLRFKDRTHQKTRRQMIHMHMIVPTTIIMMIITLPQVRPEATDLLIVRAVADNSKASLQEAEARDLSITSINFKTTDFRKVHIKVTTVNIITPTNHTSRVIKQTHTEVEAVAVVHTK